MRRFVQDAFGGNSRDLAHFAGNDADARMIAELETAVEQDLYADAKPEHRTVAGNQFQDLQESDMLRPVFLQNGFAIHERLEV